MNELSGYAVSNYVSDKGLNCPYCGGMPQIVSTADELEPGVLAQEAECCNCKKTWKEIYKLAGIREPYGYDILAV